MFFEWYQKIPSHIDPIAFTVGHFAVRWYALSYLLGFATIYILILWRINRDEGNHLITRTNSKDSNKNKLENRKYLAEAFYDLLLTVFIAALLGGRLGYVLVYDLPYFIANPLAIFSPYDSVSGEFIGISGMSYHGALVGVLTAGYIFAKFKKIDFLQWADFLVPAIPLGYFFGRIGNFFNGELYGRVTTSPIGMYFTSDPTVLRYPSQLFEALLEGIVLFLVLWLWRKKTDKSGTLLAFYVIGYALARIVAEFFREPDPQIGFLTLGFTMGQFLSLLMLIGGIIFLANNHKKKHCS